jgi:hypothetical protein
LDVISERYHAIKNSFTGLTDSYISAMTSHDPIAGLSAWGHHLINSSLGVLGSLTAIHAMPYFGKAALPYILLIVPPLFLLGVTLAYYLPAVPFIIWASAIFGWIIMVLEAFIAAPVWAAMHANPDGEGIAGQRGEMGYLLFVQVLLRVPLMIVGFFFALLMLHVISYFGEMYKIFFEGLTAQETFSGPITALAGIFLGSTILVILTHKSFSLIHALPEGVMKWMGAKGSQVSSMGEQSDTQESKSTFVGAIGGYGRAAGEKGTGKISKSIESPSAGQSSSKGGGDGEGDGSGGSSEMSGNAQSTPSDHAAGEASEGGENLGEMDFDINVDPGGSGESGVPV